MKITCKKISGLWMIGDNSAEKLFVLRWVKLACAREEIENLREVGFMTLDINQ